METIINGIPIQYSIFDNPTYVLENDSCSIKMITDALDEGFVAGELADSNSSGDWDGRGWWKRMDDESEVIDLNGRAWDWAEKNMTPEQ